VSFSAFFYVSLASPLPKIPLGLGYNPIVPPVNFTGVSSACILAIADMALNLTYTTASATYAATCTTYMESQAKTDESGTSIDFDADCTSSSIDANATAFENACKGLNANWCTTSADVSLSLDALGIKTYTVDVDLKMYSCYPSNCSKSDISAISTDFTNACTALSGYSNDEFKISNLDCKLSISCGSSAVIIIVIIIVIIVVLVVVAVVVVMVMRKRRAEYTPIKTGEYH